MSYHKKAPHLHVQDLSRSRATKNCTKNLAKDQKYWVDPFINKSEQTFQNDTFKSDYIWVVELTQYRGFAYEIFAVFL